MSRRSAPSGKAVKAEARRRLGARGKRLLGLALAGILLVGGALWVRQRSDPNRYQGYSVAQLEAWIADHPQDADALTTLARKYRDESQATNARQALERVLQLEPGNARVMNDLGELKAGQGDYVAAQQLFEQAARLRPDLPEPHRNLGDLAGIARNYVLAIRHYRQALERRPNDVQTLTSLGIASADALNRGEAEAAFQKAIALDPNRAETHQQHGLALYKFRDLAGARAALERSVQLGPMDAYTHLFLGLVYAQQPRGPEDEEKALNQFDTAAQLGYTGGEDDYGRGLVHLGRKDYPLAIAALETAVRLDAGAGDARYRLGRAYLAAGQTARGQALLQQFERLNQTEAEVRRLRHQLATQPTDAAARRRLARICLDTGRYREALQQYQILTAAGAADREMLAGMARAAAAVGDTRLAEQARGRLKAIGSTNGHE